MESRSLGSILKAAVIAGLMAGILVSIFHFVVTERVMDSAIEIEQQLLGVQEVTGETLLVSRDAQKAGLFLGFIMYGVTWSLLFGVFSHLTQSWLPGKPGFRRVLLIGLLAGWSVALFPFIKYPANPPGVGDPATIEYRQVIFLIFIALSMVATFLAFALHRVLSRPRPVLRGKYSTSLVVLATYGVGATAMYIAMPANPDAVQMPADLVRTFRVFSFIGLALFWVAFSAGLAWLLRLRKGTQARRWSGLARLRVS